MIFAALALPTAVIVGAKGTEYWLEAIEVGALVGGIGALTFYIATGGNFFESLGADAVGSFKSAACGVLHEVGL